jgi:adenine deaminase
MLCSDDLHPEMLMKRHINKVVAKLISEGFDVFDVIRSCTINPALHYGLEAGLLKPGEPSDFIVVDDFRKMNIIETLIDGKKVFENNNDSPTFSGFIRGFGLKSGAFASSVAHDSHNIISIGTNDYDIVNAVNKVVGMRGGLSVVEGKNIDSLPLPIAGIMSDQPVDKVAFAYEKLSDIVKVFGCKMSAPFMTLSFMALLVIPELKISDRGLFDGKKFCHVPLFLN